MKKNMKRDEDQKRSPRRLSLSLSRETIQVLNSPALFQLARGGDASEVTGVQDTGTYSFPISTC